VKVPVVVLDTSAVVCLFENEEGAELVEENLESAKADKIRVLLSFVTLTELFYTTQRMAGLGRASELVAVLKSWPAEVVFPDEALCLLGAELKETYPLSFADAFVAATARFSGGTLLHKDPEFRALAAVIPSESLPFKKRTRGAECRR